MPHDFKVFTELPGDMGASWEGWAGVPGAEDKPIVNLRVPFVSLKIWQYPKPPGDNHVMEASLAVARAILPAPELKKTTVFPHNVGAGAKVPGEKSAIQDYETVVEALTQVPHASTDVAAASEAFERCLVAINRLIVAYARIQRDPAVQLLSREQLDPAVMVLRRPINAPELGTWGFFASGASRFTSPKTWMGDEQVHSLVHYLALIARGHPLTESTRFHLQRGRARQAGDFSAVLIWAAVGQEIVLNTILRLLLVEEGHGPDIGEVFQRRAGLAGRINAEYAPRLGGRWNTKDVATPAGLWWSKCQVMRGRVVHGGYVPTLADAQEAIASCAALDAYLGDRLGAVRFKYPKTAYTRLGLPGLQRRGLMSERMRKLVQQIEPDLARFWETATLSSEGFH